MPDARPTLARARPADLFAGMNGTEREHAVVLEAQKRAELILDWRYEAVTLLLAPDCRYTPDFLVVQADGSLAFHETKGFWREDAKVKIRTAARLFPWFTFYAYQKRPKKDGGGWRCEEYTP